MRPDGAGPLRGIGIAAHASLAGDVAGVVEGEGLRSLTTDGAGFQAVQVVVGEGLGKAAGIPCLGALGDVGQAIVEVIFLQAQRSAWGFERGVLETGGAEVVDDVECFDATKLLKATMTTSRANPSTGVLFRAQMLGEGRWCLCLIVHFEGKWFVCFCLVTMLG
jgi:hypothetical protein